MDQTLLIIAAICFLMVLCNAFPLLALVVMVWCSFHWLGIYGGIVVTLFWLSTKPIIPNFGWIKK